MDAEVIIVGAGAAGLAAAHKLREKKYKIIILEARNRIGGRIYSHYSSQLNTNVELGAEYIHGSPPEIYHPIRKYQLPLAEVVDKHYLFKDGRFEKDTSFWEEIDFFLKDLQKSAQPHQNVEIFLKTQTPRIQKVVRNFIENFHAANLSKLGQKELAFTEKDSNDETMARWKDSYLHFLKTFFKETAGIPELIYLNRTVKKIAWKNNNCRLEVETGNTLVNYHAPKVLVTAPIGVLKQNPDLFHPRLSEKEKLLSEIHMGAALRITFLFDHNIWKERLGETGGFIHNFDSESFPVWWTNIADEIPRVTGWIGGPAATIMSELPDNQIFDMAVKQLAMLFGKSQENLNKSILEWNFHNWQKDPYALGAYSYLGVNSLDSSKIVSDPVEDTLFFAGEGMSQDSARGTVDAAIKTGFHAAQQIIRSFEKR